MATRRAVSLVLWSLSVSITSARSTSCILRLDLGLQLVELAGLDEARRCCRWRGSGSRRRPAGSGCGRTPAGARGRPRCERSGWASRRPWRARSGVGAGRRTASARPRASALPPGGDGPRLGRVTASAPRPPRCRWRACSVTPPTRCGAVRAGAVAQRRARRAARRRRGRARRRSPSTRCAGSAPPRRCARRLAPKAPPPRSTRCCSSRSRCSGRPASRRTPSTRWSTRPWRRRAARAAQRRLRQRRAAPLPARARGDRRRGARRDPVARFNHPAWWIERLRADWPERWQAILEADNRASADDLARQRPARRRRGVSSRRSPRTGIAADALGGAGGALLERPLPVTQLPGFADGEVSVQDAAAQRAAPLLLAAPPRARRARPRRLRRARRQDRAPARARRPRPARARPRLRRGWRASTRRWRRLGLRARDARRRRGATPARWWDGRPFDAILLDAPCSASGIVRRHPDVRWLRRAERHRRAGARPRRACSTRSGRCSRRAAGCSTCTCSVFKAEGSAQIDAFLQRQPAMPALPPARRRPGTCCRCPTIDETPPAPGFSARGRRLLPRPDRESFESTPMTARR